MWIGGFLSTCRVDIESDSTSRSRQLPVQTPILNRLCHMRRTNRVGLVEASQRTRDAERMVTECGNKTYRFYSVASTVVCPAYLKISKP